MEKTSKNDGGTDGEEEEEYGEEEENWYSLQVIASFF